MVRVGWHICVVSLESMKRLGDTAHSTNLNIRASNVVVGGMANGRWGGRWGRWGPTSEQGRGAEVSTQAVGRRQGLTLPVQGVELANGPCVGPNRAMRIYQIILSVESQGNDFDRPGDTPRPDCPHLVLQAVRMCVQVQRRRRRDSPSVYDLYDAHAAGCDANLELTFEAVA